eukprot:6299114-Ditylum_brightwellii.AAC.1
METMHSKDDQMVDESRDNFICRAREMQMPLKTNTSGREWGEEHDVNIVKFLIEVNQDLVIIQPVTKDISEEAQANWRN